MKYSNIYSTANIADYFNICLHLSNLAGLYDKYTLHLYKDDEHFTPFTCNHLELISKLTFLDYTQYPDIFVYGQTKGNEKPNEFTLLFVILNRYRNSDRLVSLIKFTYY